MMEYTVMLKLICWKDIARTEVIWFFARDKRCSEYNYQSCYL